MVLPMQEGMTAANTWDDLATLGMVRDMKIRRIVGCLGLTALSVCVFGQANTPRFVELHKDPSVELQRSTPLGPKAESDMLHLAVSLPFGDPQGAQAFADAVSDPKSPLYRHFISPEEVGNRFGLPAYRIQRVLDYLTSQGMSVRLIGKNRLSILLDATVGQAQTAFHTSIQNFAVPATDESPATMRFSFTTPPSLPTEFAADVIDVCGIDSFTRPLAHTALTASQMRTLYSAATMYGGGGSQGKGRTIAISSFDGFRISNVALECTLQSLPTPTAGAGSNVTIEAVSGGTGSTGTASGEGDLDIQAVLCMAPLANVIVYDNYSTTGNNPVAVLTQEVNDNTADIITESYGWQMGASSNLAAHNLHLSMTSQGITYMAASGDHGTTWTVSGVDFDYPATDPEVLSVGGTSATVTGSGTRSTEVGWNSVGDAGGGGWNVTTDTFNTRPTYQSTSTFLAGPGVPSLASVPYRLVPDVSFDADPNTGYLIYVSGTEYQYGGTSASSPTCAGLLAELEEQLISDGALTANSSGKYRLGRVQDLLYSFNGLSSVFFDVISGTNGTLPNGVVSNAGPGWDTDSGWGPIIMSGLLAQIEKGVSSVALSPASVTGGAASTGTVTLSVAAPTGGAVVTLTSSNTSVATVPASVTVAAGATSATFTVSSLSVSSTQSATISASYNGITHSASLTVNPVVVTLSSVALSPSTLIGGSSSTGQVNLSAAAPAGGAVVSLKSSSSSATLPASVTVAAGASSATFAIATTAVSSNTSSTITATVGTSSVTSTLTIQSPTPKSLVLSASSVVGGSNATITGTVTLSGPAPSGGSVVTLSSSSTSTATVAGSVTVPAGATSATFAITHKVVTSSTSTTIKATIGSTSQSSALTVQPFTITGLSISPSTLIGGASATGTITLNAVPASGAITVSLKSSSTSASVSSSVSVAVGSSTATFTITTKAVKSNTSATITGTLGSSSKTATLTIQV
jgi:hypothetical protein